MGLGGSAVSFTGKTHTRVRSKKTHTTALIEQIVLCKLCLTFHNGRDYNSP